MRVPHSLSLVLSNILWVSAASAQTPVALRSWGCEDMRTPVQRGDAIQKNNRVEYQYKNNLTEWYESSPRGIEQGFTVHNKPLCDESEVLEFEVQFDTPQPLIMHYENARVRAINPNTKERWSYSELVAYDSSGRVLPSSLSVENNAIIVRVDVRGASYPLIVDPLIATETETIRSNPTGDLFGHSVAIDGNTAVVGAWDDDQASFNTGAVYIYTLNMGVWSLQQKIASPDVTAYRAFGTTVALLGNRLIVGASANSGSPAIPGAAYVYDRIGNTWSLVQTLQAPAPAANDYFGWSIAMDSTRLFIGNQGYFASNGAFEYYDTTGAPYAHKQTITFQNAPVSSSYSQLGQSLALQGNTLIVGAQGSDIGPVVDRGEALVFQQDMSGVWSYSATLPIPSMNNSALCGLSVALLPGYALVGCPFDTSAGGQGSVAVFAGSGASWTYSQSLTLQDINGNRFGAAMRVDNNNNKIVIGGVASDGSTVGRVFINPGQWDVEATLYTPGAVIGTFDNHASVAISGNTILLGGQSADALGIDSGNAIIHDFDGQSWQQTQTLEPSNGSPGDRFGNSISSDGTWMIVGAPLTNQTAQRSGKAEVFENINGAWTLHKVLAPVNLVTDAQFGTSVAVSGNLAVVGAPLVADHTGTASVYGYNGSTWVNVATLSAPSYWSTSLFGFAVATDGTRVFVSDPFAESLGTQTGAIYVYEATPNWTLTATLVPDGPLERLGSSLAVQGDTVAAGALLYNGVAGRGYVFTYAAGNWSKLQILDRPNPGTNEYFGATIAMDGDTILVGAQTNGSHPPKAHEFARTGGFPGTWNYVGEVGTAQFAYYGFPVALKGNTALIGEGLPAGGGRFTFFERDLNGVFQPQATFDNLPAGLGAGEGAVLLADKTVLLGRHSATIAGEVVEWGFKLSQGDPCTIDTDCASNFCVDLVCCDTACGLGQPNDCQACSVAQGATIDGTCTVFASSQLCRATDLMNSCDSPEFCDGINPDCPVDTLSPDGTDCDAGTGKCMGGTCIPTGGTGGIGGTGGTGGTGGAAGTGGMAATGGSSGIGGSGATGAIGGTAGSGGSGGASSGASGSGGIGGQAGTMTTAGTSGTSNWPDLWSQGGAAGQSGNGANENSTGAGANADTARSSYQRTEASGCGCEVPGTTRNGSKGSSLPTLLIAFSWLFVAARRKEKASLGKCNFGYPAFIRIRVCDRNKYIRTICGVPLNCGVR